jgi:glycosyltransferase involved in cell wall biosynthesis
MQVDFVIPVYNERDTLEALTTGILEHAAPHAVRIVFVDDGSTDGSTEVLRSLSQTHPEVEVIRFRRNFGKAAGLAAGFARTNGDVVFTMDADLQDDPAEIPHFLAKLEEGFDVVVGWKAKRLDPWHKTFPSHVYNGAVGRLFRLPLHDINCGFKAYRGEVVKKLRVYGELHRLLPALAQALGYRITEIPVQHHPRRYGVSKYGFERFAKGAMDVVAVWFVTRHAYTPGHFFGKWGVLSLLIGKLCGLAGIVFGLLFKSFLTLGLWWTAGSVFAVGGIMLMAIALIAEFFLQHQVKLDPAEYTVEVLGRKDI